MYTVKDKRTGKFLRNFSGSYNDFTWRMRYCLEKDTNTEPTGAQIHNAMWCEDTTSSAKTFKSKRAIITAFNSYRYRGDKKIPLSEALPWLEMVQITDEEALEALRVKFLGEDCEE